MKKPKEHEDSVNLDKCWDEEKVELTDTDLKGVDGGKRSRSSGLGNPIIGDGYISVLDNLNDML